MDDNCTSSVTIEVDKDTDRPGKAWKRLQLGQNQKKLEILNPEIEKMCIDKVRFVCISDTHSGLERVRDPYFLPAGDVLLHAGDFTEGGTVTEIKEFNDYLGTLPYKHKIVISGNCDLALDSDYNNSRYSNVVQKHLKDKSVKDLFTYCTYLEDSMVEICGIKIYGSPWTPAFCDLGFNSERGEEILKKWNKIPEGIDILITHGPPVGYGDITSAGRHVGCVELLTTVQQRVRPKYHVYGHVHNDYGMLTDGTTTYINAATYGLVNEPIVFDFPLPEGYTKENL